MSLASAAPYDAASLRALGEEALPEGVVFTRGGVDENARRLAR